MKLREPMWLRYLAEDFSYLIVRRKTGPQLRVKRGVVHLLH